MTKEKMSITRALVEKKRISERIDRDIRNLKNPIQLTIGDSIVGGFSSNEDFLKYFLSYLGSLASLFVNIFIPFVSIILILFFSFISLR